MPPTPIALTSSGYLHQPIDADGHPTPPTADGQRPQGLPLKLASAVITA